LIDTNLYYLKDNDKNVSVEKTSDDLVEKSYEVLNKNLTKISELLNNVN
jgi:hypothetical protein